MKIDLSQQPSDPSIADAGPDIYIVGPDGSQEVYQGTPLFPEDAIVE